MASWRELGRHMAALDDIGTILSAMRSLAFIETRRLLDSTARQADVLNATRVALDQLTMHYPAAQPTVAPASDVLLLIGSERGLCGDFDERIASHTEISGHPQPDTLIAVGSRLSQRLDERDITCQPMAGASVIEDIPEVMAQIAASVWTSTQAGSDRPLGLVVIYHGDTGVMRERVLPVPPSSPPRRWRSRPQLQLPPPRLYGMLVEHYVLASLNAILLASLLAENRSRLDQMSSALDRLHERLDDLDHQRRRARQEAITEEIEIITLGDGQQA